ncbi:MAG: DUF3145 domain-containing protein [Actinobacteria bacterium]|nr:DUF3145 domain-containing protein [Actinomycetota bacterium]MCA1722108.1 DUF3145 domain-containing protein [Actinomycetota bacterium]
MVTSGVLYVHSCPPALCPHVEWAVAAELGVRVRLDWTGQPASPGTLRAEIGWRGRSGTAGRLAGALRGWSVLRYEVTEDPSAGCDGERYAVTPTLGVFRATTSANGDLLVGEDRLRALLANASGPQLAMGLDALLGSPWDAELEPYREAGEGAAVTWLHQVV